MIESVEGTLLDVCVGATGELIAGRRRIKSAFNKTQVGGRVHLATLGLPGDEHVYDDHGGPDMAVLVYPVEHYAHWRDLGLRLPDAGAFGENFTVRGLVETDVYLGDVFEVGEATVQVCQPRSPCYKLSARFGRKDMSVRMQDTGYTGYLLRVLQAGEVGAGDTIRLIDRDRPDPISVAEAGQIVNVRRSDTAGARRVLDVASLGVSTRTKLEARLGSDDDLTGLETDRLFLPEP